MTDYQQQSILPYTHYATSVSITFGHVVRCIQGFLSACLGPLFSRRGRTPIPSLTAPEGGPLGQNYFKKGFSVLSPELLGMKTHKPSRVTGFETVNSGASHKSLFTFWAYAFPWFVSSHGVQTEKVVLSKLGSAFLDFTSYASLHKRGYFYPRFLLSVSNSGRSFLSLCSKLASAHARLHVVFFSLRRREKVLSRTWYKLRTEYNLRLLLSSKLSKRADAPQAHTRSRAPVACERLAISFGHVFFRYSEIVFLGVDLVALLRGLPEKAVFAVSSKTVKAVFPFVHNLVATGKDTCVSWGSRSRATGKTRFIASGDIPGFADVGHVLGTCTAQLDKVLPLTAYCGWHALLADVTEVRP